MIDAGEVMLGAALAACMLTGVNLVLAQRALNRTRTAIATYNAQAAKDLAMMKEALALHDYGAHAEAILLMAEAGAQAGQQVQP